MKKIIIAALAALSLACAGQSVVEVEEPGISQQSVVSPADFTGSVLYGPFARYREEGPVVPGLAESLVPQGMVWWEAEDLMIISSYSDNNSAGALTFLHMGEGSFQKVLFLHNDDGSPHRGHLGGLAMGEEELWLASGPGIYSLPLDLLKVADNQSRIILPPILLTETKGSFATSDGSVLWVGEFTRKDGSYAVPEYHHMKNRDDSVHRAWLGGYELEKLKRLSGGSGVEGKKIQPDYILSIPDEVQGALFLNNSILLSASYGRKNYSRILVFDNPLGGEPHSSYRTPDESDVPLWFLDNVNNIGKMVAPPMSEAIALREDKAVILFESAARKYRDTALFPLDRLQSFPAEAFETR